MEFQHTNPTRLSTFINEFYNKIWIFQHRLSFSNPISVDEFKFQQEILDPNPFVLSWLLNIHFSLRRVQNLVNLSEYNFCDVGCGTGISTIYAGKWNFREISGFDFQSEFIEKARLNLLNGRKIRSDIKFSVADACQVRIQSKSVLFFFNPFGKMTTEIFIKNNISEFSQGKTIVILCNDHLLGEFLDSNLFSLKFRHPRLNYSILRSVSISTKIE